MTRKSEVLRLMHLADQKGFGIARSTVRDHWKLIDGAGKTVWKRDSNSAAFTVREASTFLEAIPDRST